MHPPPFPSRYFWLQCVPRERPPPHCHGAGSPCCAPRLKVHSSHWGRETWRLHEGACMGRSHTNLLMDLPQALHHLLIQVVCDGPAEGKMQYQGHRPKGHNLQVPGTPRSRKVCLPRSLWPHTLLSQLTADRHLGAPVSSDCDLGPGCIPPVPNSTETSPHRLGEEPHTDCVLRAPSGAAAGALAFLLKPVTFPCHQTQGAPQLPCVITREQHVPVTLP